MSFRRILWRFIKSILFLLDAERAHRCTISAVLWARKIGGDPLLRITSGTPLAPLTSATPSAQAVKVFGIPFASRVGLAAGFDKDAELVPALPALGFGFAEIGTVTPRPQPGNPKPRLFRDPARASLFNRMGFNGQGAEAVAARLTRARGELTGDFRVGINVGKNKDTSLEPELAARDYAQAAAAFSEPGLIDYLVINVSSPNTPGLRSLQTTQALRPIVEAVNQLTERWSKRPPLLLKLAPELKSGELTQVIEEAEAWGIDGWVLTNTLAGTFSGGSGGWSGGILTELARESLVEARAATRLPIISVGGIMSAEEAALRIKLGADLVQIYSGWIYGGPSFPSQLSAQLSAQLSTRLSADSRLPRSIN